MATKRAVTSPNGVALGGLALQPEGKLARILSGAEDIDVKTAAAFAVLAAHHVRRPSAYLAMMAPGLERELTKPEHRSDGN